ncbi:MAG TPA: multicopper oxidase domain-containing protein, partial [Chitinophagales bacterium]|nr:multicopper oxidase domain-containing protein [Chitinophagales bacterium]
MPVRHSLIFLSFVIHLSLHLCASITASAQTLIPIPDTLSGNTLLLTIDDSVTQFFTGYNTATIGYNGSYLGPTLILRQGDSVTLHVRNALDDTTTTHWHGLHVSPMNDGGPHSLILPGQTWMPHFTVMDKAATYWYHPHLHGKTMAQIVKGAAGLIIVRDSEEAALALPRTYGVDDIPLIFQFQTFDTVTRQIMVNDDFDNAVVVNGTLNGMLNIPAQVVRLRLLNASSLRFFRFGISDNRAFYQIATDNSLLDAPVSLTRLELSPGERAEILIDFTGEQQGSTLFLKTFGSEMPTGYPGGPPLMTMPLGPLDNLDFIVLQFNVTAPASGAVTAIPDALVSNTIWSQAGASTRYINFTAQPMMSTNFFINNVKFDMGVINFSVQQETVEIWDINNLTFMAHPFHIHGNHFYVIEKNGMQPPLNEQGRKDVVLVPAMGSVKIITKYAD